MINMNASINTELYIRRKEDCYEIKAGEGFFINEMLGPKNGNCSVLSIAHEEFAPFTSSHAHAHSKADEYQVCLSGRGKIVIGNETRIVTPGVVVAIPKGKFHKTINEHEEPLELYCLLTPPWSAEDTTFVDNIPLDLDEKGTIYMRSKDDCVKIIAGKGETIYELLGKENGSCEELSVALVEIQERGCSEAHTHPEAEENYIILEGQARLEVDGKTYTVSSGQLVQIRAKAVHKIFNDLKETLKFYCVCTPAWTPDCFIKV